MLSIEHQRGILLKNLKRNYAPSCQFIGLRLNNHAIIFQYKYNDNLEMNSEG